MDIVLAGDICFENRAEKLLTEGKSILTKDFEEYWKSKDYRIANLESPITSSNNKINKVGRHIKASPKVSNGIKKLQIDHFTLANNHIMDYGVEGLHETVDVLKKNEIGYFGIKTKDEKLPFKKLEKNDVSVGIIAISNNEFSVYQNFKGLGAIGFNEAETIENIKELKKSVDHVVVIWHTGLSKFKYPSPNQHKTCKSFIDAGASVVTCQHSHIVGAYEYYNDGFICYGQGSTVFDLSRTKSDWNFGTTLDINFTVEDFKVNVIPHIQFDENANIRLMTKNEREDFYKSIEECNKILSDDNKMGKEWTKYISSKESYYYKSFIAPKNKIIRKLTNFFPVNKIFGIRLKLVLLNYLENEEHREVIIELIKNKLVEPQNKP